MARTAKLAIPDEPIQPDPPGASKLFDDLYAQFSGELERSSMARLPHDDAQDVLITVWTKVWRALLIPGKFEYRGEQAGRAWLFTILERAITDHWRSQVRRKKLMIIPFDAEIELDDNSIVSLVETIPADQEDDPADRILRERVVEVAEQCLHNEKQLELLKRRILGQPLPSEWPESWINTNWSRIKDKLLEAFRNR